MSLLKKKHKVSIITVIVYIISKKYIDIKNLKLISYTRVGCYIYIFVLLNLILRNTLNLDQNSHEMQWSLSHFSFFLLSSCLEVRPVPIPSSCSQTHPVVEVCPVKKNIYILCGCHINYHGLFRQKSCKYEHIKIQIHTTHVRSCARDRNSPNFK